MTLMPEAGAAPAPGKLPPCVDCAAWEPRNCNRESPCNRCVKQGNRLGRAPDCCYRRADGVFCKTAAEAAAAVVVLPRCDRCVKAGAFCDRGAQCGRCREKGLACVRGGGGGDGQPQPEPVAAASAEPKSWTTRKQGQLSYFLNAAGRAILEPLVKELQFLQLAIVWPFVLQVATSGLPIAGAVQSAITVAAVVKSLDSFLCTRELEFVKQDGNKVLFYKGAGGAFFSVPDARVEDVRAILERVLRDAERLCPNEYVKLKALAKDLRQGENKGVVKRIGHGFELSNKWRVRALVSRFVIGIGLEVAKRCNSREEWHGITRKYIETRAGTKAFSNNGDGVHEADWFYTSVESDEAEVAELAAATGATRLEPDKIALGAVEEALCLVRQQFALAGACCTTTSGGVDPSEVGLFLDSCVGRAEDFPKLLQVVKLLQQLWRQLVPDYKGVLLYSVARKLPVVALPNKSFKSRHGCVDWEAMFAAFAKEHNGDKYLPRFDVFLHPKGSFKGGVMSDCHGLLLYGIRPQEKLQRTLERTTADFLSRPQEVMAELERPAQFVKEVMHKVTKATAQVVRPFGADNFTGLLMLETLRKYASRDFFNGRVSLIFDPGKIEVLAGQCMVDGWRGPSFSFPTRDLFRRTGRDAVERAGRANRTRLEKKHGIDRLFRDMWEAGERATDEVLHERPDNAQFMADAPFVQEQFTARAKVQSEIPMSQNDCFAKIAWKCVERIQEAVRHSGSTKKPVILLGDRYTNCKGAHGGRGFLAKQLVEYLAQFFLIIIVPEHLTSLLCPPCHRKTEFASEDSWRGKVCENCPVAGGDFFYDRDYGAASNIYYKAVFYMRSGGFYPPQYITKKELEKRKKLVLQFLTELEIAHIHNSGAKSANEDPENGNPQ